MLPLPSPTRRVRRVTPRFLLEVLLLSTIAVATFWGYAGTLDDYFIMDDFDMIAGHSSFEQFIRHWSSPVGANSYRPLIDLLFIWDFYWWEWNPFGWHLSDVLFHVLNSLFVYALAKKLSDSVYAAFVAGILFGLHTSHTEAVTWISARMDVVCTTFYLGAVLAFITLLDPRHPRRKRRISWPSLMSLGCFGCALFIKEMAVTLPGVLVLYDAVFHRVSWRWKLSTLWAKIRLHAPYALLLAVYFALRANALSGGEEYGSKARAIIGGYHVDLFSAVVFENLVVYFKFLAIPFVDRIFSDSLMLNLLGIGLFAGICIVASRVSRFTVLWIFVTLIPVYSLNIGRGVYLASVGFCVLAGIILTFPIHAAAPLPWGMQNRSRLRLARVLVRAVQVVVLLALVQQYAISLQVSNAWWGRVAEINQDGPQMINALLSERADRGSVSTLCIENMPLVFNQRFNSAFNFQFPDDGFEIYQEPSDVCAEGHVRNGSAAHIAFLYYDRSDTLHDVTFEARTRLAMAPHAPTYQEFRTASAPHALTATQPELTLDVQCDAPVAALDLVSVLANGIDVPQGTVVAQGRVEFAQGEPAAFRFVAGENTAEWAIRFPHIQPLVQHASPTPHTRWTVKQPDGTFAVAQNYVLRLTFDAPRQPVRLRLERASLPDDLVVSVDLNYLMCYPTPPPEADTIGQ